MQLPLRLFWTLVKNKNRIEARENLRLIRRMAFPNLAEGGQREYIAEQESTLGTIAVTDERDTEAINKLKDLK